MQWCRSGRMGDCLRPEGGGGHLFFSSASFRSFRRSSFSRMRTRGMSPTSSSPLPSDESPVQFSHSSLLILRLLHDTYRRVSLRGHVDGVPYLPSSSSSSSWIVFLVPQENFHDRGAISITLFLSLVALNFVVNEVIQPGSTPSFPRRYRGFPMQHTCLNTFLSAIW